MFVSKRGISLALAFVIAFATIASIGAEPASANDDLTTQYRVYQNDNMLKEFVSLSQAIAYAKYFSNSYVEKIGTREWVFSQFPTYVVYQRSNELKRFYSLSSAQAYAKQFAFSSVRDLSKPGWAWSSYPNYQVYQGADTKSSWTFFALEDALKQAKLLEGAYIIDLNTQGTIWTNYTSEQAAMLRQGETKYEVVQDGRLVIGEYAYILDAVSASKKQDNLEVYDKQTGRLVYSHVKPYAVYQGERYLKSFYDVTEAVRYAALYAKTRITYNDGDMWTNIPYYQVVYQDRTLGQFHKLGEAVAFGRKQDKAKIVTTDGKTIWDNTNRVKVWTWTGSMTDATIKREVEQSSGIDVLSPTWFELSNASGGVKDTSSPELVEWLHGRGIEVHPLFHNQFDSAMTTKFLANDKARAATIATVVNRAAAIGVDGINLDFESMSGSDRSAYTKFVREFAAAAHAKGLEVSIDLPRGDLRWNARTAFDHKALAQIVDHIMIMAYDQHWSGSDVPGSVSGLQWAEQGVEEFLSYGIPRDNLYFGIPFYTRVWKLDASGKLVGNSSLVTGNIAKHLEGKQTTTTWDPAFNQYRIEYAEGGYTYRFWLEDEATLTKRMEIAEEYGLAGIAAWRLGQEPDSFWTTIASEK